MSARWSGELTREDIVLDFRPLQGFIRATLLAAGCRGIRLQSGRFEVGDDFPAHRFHRALAIHVSARTSRSRPGVAVVFTDCAETLSRAATGKANIVKANTRFGV